ncbi:MAG: nucleotidyltransferase domain-containing protein [Muribaculaceae bacterium]|nr:nucleotidyltransferase domain-containing protein [Muribaculaceae bacterium]
MDIQNTYKYHDVAESSESIRRRLRKYFESQPISKAWLFGSRSRGDYREDSDYDILVSLDDNVGLFKYAAIMSDLEELLNKAVDLVSETSLLPWVKDEVEKEKVLIYERKA